MNRPKVLITNPTAEDVVTGILSDKCDLIIANNDSREDILSKAKGVDGILWVTTVHLNKEILDAAGPQLRTVVTRSSGYNHIDTSELKARGITFGNAPHDILSASVADMGVLLTLAVARRLTEMRLLIEEGTWKNIRDGGELMGRDIGGSTVGIIGFGGIGQTFAKRMKGFEVSRILYNGPREKAEGKQLGAEFTSLDTLLKESDIIFLSAPLNDETREMCNEDFFSKMKKTGIFVNVSRGGLVDQNALIRALKENRIYGAGLDVMTPEPLPPDHELLKLRNVVLVPHLGGATLKTRNTMTELAAHNLLRGLEGEPMITPVKL